MAVGGRVDINDQAIIALLNSPAGALGAYMVNGAQRVTQGAKRRAPVGEDSKTSRGWPGGYLRSQIAWEMGTDGSGVYVDIETSARNSVASPNAGDPYSLYVETGARPASHKTPPFAVTQPYLVPALADWPT